ncbi:MAG: (2Fe-2S)-binding protein [Bdellovibrionota bacterium]
MTNKIPQLSDLAGSQLSEDDERTTCFCHNVNVKTIREAIRRGADTVEKIKSETCASTGCGGCEWDVMMILEEELKKR